MYAIWLYTTATYMFYMNTGVKMNTRTELEYRNELRVLCEKQTHMERTRHTYTRRGEHAAIMWCREYSHVLHEIERVEYMLLSPLLATVGIGVHDAQTW